MRLLQNGKFAPKSINNGKTKIPIIIFSKKATDIISEIIKTQNVPYAKIENLDEEENTLIMKILEHSKFNMYRDTLYKNKKSMRDRLELLLAGLSNNNNGNEVKNEISSILSEMYKRRYISHTEFKNIIQKLFF